MHAIQYLHISIIEGCEWIYNVKYIIDFVEYRMFIPTQLHKLVLNTERERERAALNTVNSLITFSINFGGLCTNEISLEKQF